MDSYIVRIYEFDPQDHSPTRGVVEVVATGGLAPFEDRDQLWAVLSARAPVADAEARFAAAPRT